MSGVDDSGAAGHRSAQAAAVAALGAYPPRPGAVVVYQDEGSLLIAGGADQALVAGERLASRHRVVAVVSGQVPGRRQRGLAVVPGRLRRVEGWLGRFRAYADGPGGQLLDLGPLSPRADGCFDRVLDVSDEPLLDLEVLPVGYEAPGADPQAVARAVERLASASGRYEKPRYFRFDATLCVHGARGLVGCTRCLDVCPAGAIDCVGDKVVVEPCLCQGCGTCALVCPTGALAYAYPAREVTLAGLARALATYRSAAGEAPRLLVYDGETSLDPEGLPADVVPLRTHAVAGLGVEVWLSALAWGWAGVYLLPRASTPARTRGALAREVELARLWLGAQGEGAERLRLIAGQAEVDSLPGPAPAPMHAMGEPPPGKRAVLLAAIDALGPCAPGGDAVVAVPEGSPFGALRLDPQRCTLCLGCVGLCPTGALQGEAGELRFTESSCVQCGLCAAGCPERALGLTPRLNLRRDDRNRPAPLHRADLFRCVSCGEPFAPVALVRAATARVGHLPMFQGEGLRLLELCPACRMRETMGAGRSGSG